MWFAFFLLVVCISKYDFHELQDEENEETPTQQKVSPKFRPLKASHNESSEKLIGESSVNEPEEDKSQSNNLPKLVPLVFPPGFFENEGKSIIKALETKIKSVFGELDATKLENMNSPEALFELVEKKDFHNFAVNFIVKNCIKFIKPKEPKTMGSITSKAECKKICRQSQSSAIQFVQRTFQSVISKFIQEDLRFSFSQDPKKCFLYFYDPVKEEHICQCVDKGYKVKVSPRLLELINTTYFQKKNAGSILVEEILEENPNENISKMGGVFNLKRIVSVFLSLTGIKKNDTRNGHDKNYAIDHFMEFILKHLVISVILFVFCHCFWYVHIIYFAIALIGELLHFV